MGAKSSRRAWTKKLAPTLEGDTYPLPMTFTLPWPPSVNDYWRVDPRTQTWHVKDAGVAYRDQAVKQIALETPRGNLKPISDEVLVGILVHPPDRRNRDTDNLYKASYDAITAAMIWLDDSQVADEMQRRLWVVPGGKLVVTIASRDYWTELAATLARVPLQQP